MAAIDVQNFVFDFQNPTLLSGTAFKKNATYGFGNITKTGGTPIHAKLTITEVDSGVTLTHVDGHTNTDGREGFLSTYFKVAGGNAAGKGVKFKIEFFSDSAYTTKADLANLRLLTYDIDNTQFQSFSFFDQAHIYSGNPSTAIAGGKVTGSNITASYDTSSGLIKFQDHSKTDDGTAKSNKYTAAVDYSNISEVEFALGDARSGNINALFLVEFSGAKTVANSLYHIGPEATTSSTQLNTSFTAAQAGAPSITYADKFVEVAGNDGSIQAATFVTVTLPDGYSFKAASTPLTLSNLPVGLTANLEKITETTAKIVLSGNASAHDIDINNLGVTFTDAHIQAPSGKSGPLDKQIGGTSKQDLLIDFITATGTVPAPKNISIVSDAGVLKTYGAGEKVVFAVDFTEPVKATGSPDFDFSLQDTGEAGADLRKATYDATLNDPTKPNTLYFSYVVKLNDKDLDGITLPPASAIQLNAGAIKDVAGNSATLTLPNDLKNKAGTAPYIQADHLIGVYESQINNTPATTSVPTIVTSNPNDLTISFEPKNSPVTVATISNITVVREDSVTITSPSIEVDSSTGEIKVLFADSDTSTTGTQPYPDGYYKVVYTDPATPASPTVIGRVLIATSGTSQPVVTPLTTDQQKPTVTGSLSSNSALKPGETLSVIISNTTYKNVPVASDGKWSVTVTETLPGNTYNVTATVTPLNGAAVSDTSSGELVIVTGLNPAPSGFALTTATDLGQTGDFLTSHGNPVLTFVAQPGLNVVLTGPQDEALVEGIHYTLTPYTGSAGTAGTYTVTLLDADSGVSGNQPFGNYQNGKPTGNQDKNNGDGLYKVTAVLKNGSEVLFSKPLGEFTIETVRPNGPTVTPQITKNITPVITGTAVLDATEVESLEVTVGSVVYKNVPVDAQGNWRINTATTTDSQGKLQTFPHGTYNVDAVVTDKAGNRHTDTTLGELIVDTVHPVVPTVQTQTFYNATPTVTGTARLELGEVLTVEFNGATYTNVPVNGGTWSINTATTTPASGKLGTWENGTSYSVTATVTDRAGNSTVDVSTSELLYIISTSAPGIPGMPGAPSGGNAPNYGNGPLPSDSNGDGVPDSGQGNVTSAHFVNTPYPSNAPGGNAVTVSLVTDSNQGRTDTTDWGDSRISLFTQTDTNPTKPAGLSTPLGGIDIKVDFVNTPNGWTETFSLFVPSTSDVNGLWVQGNNGTWVNLASPAYGGSITQQNGQTRVDFQIQDGGMFDKDFFANGSISFHAELGKMPVSIVGYTPELPFGSFLF